MKSSQPNGASIPPNSPSKSTKTKAKNANVNTPDGVDKSKLTHSILGHHGDLLKIITVSYTPHTLAYLIYITVTSEELVQLVKLRETLEKEAKTSPVRKPSKKRNG
jgi:hypothetical protein